MDDIISIEICERCAACCKNYPFIELSQSEIAAIEKVTGLDLDVFTIAKGKAVEEYFLNFKENGDCYFLKENNGRHLCSIYATRPSICAKYPSTPKQQEACDSNR